MGVTRIALPPGRSQSRRLTGIGTAVICFVLASFAVGAEAGIELWPDKTGGPFGSLLPTSGRASLLDPSKLGISHQLVFSYSSGNAGKNNLGGLWLSNFSYKFSSPLTVDLSVGTALSKTGSQGFTADRLFLESLSLHYKPNENLYFQLMYSEAPRSFFLFPEGHTR